MVCPLVDLKQMTESRGRAIIRPHARRVYAFCFLLLLSRHTSLVVVSLISFLPIPDSIFSLNMKYLTSLFVALTTASVVNAAAYTTPIPEPGPDGKYTLTAPGIRAKVLMQSSNRAALS